MTVAVGKSTHCVSALPVTPISFQRYLFIDFDLLPVLCKLCSGGNVDHRGICVIYLWTFLKNPLQKIDLDFGEKNLHIKDSVAEKTDSGHLRISSQF